jgi:hypothetical protein
VRGVASTENLDFIEGAIDGVAESTLILIWHRDGATKRIDGLPCEIEFCDAGHGRSRRNPQAAVVGLDLHPLVDRAGVFVGQHVQQ